MKKRRGVSARPPLTRKDQQRSSDDKIHREIAYENEI